MERDFPDVADCRQQQAQEPNVEWRMRVTLHVHELSQEYIADVSRMGRIDLGMFGSGEIVDVVALDGLVQEGRPQ